MLLLTSDPVLCHSSIFRTIVRAKYHVSENILNIIVFKRNYLAYDLYSETGKVQMLWPVQSISLLGKNNV